MTDFPSEGPEGGIGGIDALNSTGSAGGVGTFDNWSPTTAVDQDPHDVMLDAPTFAADEAHELEPIRTQSLGIQMLRVFMQNKMAVIFLILLIAIAMFSFLGPLFYHTNQTNLSLFLGQTPNQPPSAQHPLGTDGQCFDMLGRLMVGGQSSLEVGLLAAVVAMVLGVAYGVFAGYRGGWADSILMRCLDVLLSIPGLFLVLAAVTIFGRQKYLMIIIIGITGWYGVARLLRAEALTLREREYAQAVRAMGGTSRRIVWRHIMPNSISTTVTLATFAIGDSILALAGLGFLGYGILTPDTDWGTILNTSGTAILLNYWWETWPVMILFLIVVMSFNFIGDALRDSFEVRLRER